MNERPPYTLLLRQLAAMFYDALLLLGVLFFASLPVTLLSGGAVHSGTLAFQLYLLAVIFVYLGWQWTHGGQTLGMKAWRLRLVMQNGKIVDWDHAARRFLAALLSVAAAGLGFLWQLIDQQGLSWHDRLSATQLVITPQQQPGWHE